MFIEDNETINITIYYKKVGKTYIAYGDSEFKETIKDEGDIAKYKKLIVTMRTMTWGLYNDLQEMASVYDVGAGKNVFHFKKYKEEKLKKLILSWDATRIEKDGKVVPVPVNEKAILSLAPSIAETLISQYDDISVLDEDDEKK